MKTTAIGIRYEESKRLHAYLQCFLFCLESLRKNRHFELKTLKAKFGDSIISLTDDECYQIIAEAESYLDNNSQNESCPF